MTRSQYIEFKKRQRQGRGYRGRAYQQKRRPRRGWRRMDYIMPRTSEPVPVPASAVGGAGTPKPLYFDISYDDLKKIPANQKEEFAYTTPRAGVTIAAALGSVVDVIIGITQEADFICTKLVAHSTLVAGETVASGLQTNDSDRQLQNDLVPLDSYWGTAQRPRLLTNPRVFRRAQSLTITNEVVAAALGAPRLLWFTLNGFKVFYDISQLNLTTRHQ